MADKDALNQTLNESCAELREKNANMKENVKKAEDALQKIQEQEQAHRDEMTALELENKRKIRELEQQLKEVQNENERSSFEKENCLKYNSSMQIKWSNCALTRRAEWMITSRNIWSYLNG